MNTDIKYPNIKVRLTGTDGNAFAVIGTVRSALKKAGVAKEEIDKFSGLCMQGDYDDLVRTCCEWVEVL